MSGVRPPVWLTHAARSTVLHAQSGKLLCHCQASGVTSHMSGPSSGGRMHLMCSLPMIPYIVPHPNAPQRPRTGPARSDPAIWARNGSQNGTCKRALYSLRTVPALCHVSYPSPTSQVRPSAVGKHGKGCTKRACQHCTVRCIQAHGATLAIAHEVTCWVLTPQRVGGNRLGGPCPASQQAALLLLVHAGKALPIGPYI